MIEIEEMGTQRDLSKLPLDKGYSIRIVCGLV